MKLNVDVSSLLSCTENLEDQIIESSKKQLLERGHNYYCSKCCTVNQIVSSSIQGVCPDCNMELILINALK